MDRTGDNVDKIRFLFGRLDLTDCDQQTLGQLEIEDLSIINVAYKLLGG